MTAKIIDGKAFAANLRDKFKLVTCEFSEVIMSIHVTYNYVNPDQELHFEYFTSKGVL